MAKRLNILQMLLFGTRKLNHKVEMQRLQCKNEISDLKTETHVLKDTFVDTVTSPVALGLFSVAGFLTGYLSRNPAPRLKKTIRFVKRRIPWPMVLTLFSSLLTRYTSTEKNNDADNPVKNNNFTEDNRANHLSESSSLH